jgi:hypothetical protein
VKRENAEAGFQLLISDTPSNGQAAWDWRDLNHRSKLEKQLGLSDLRKGADTLEIRLWYDFSLADLSELYVVKIYDTSCLLSYYAVYSRPFKYDDTNGNQTWDPYNDPIVDSAFSRTSLLTNEEYRKLYCDSVWFLKSQSELDIPDSIGFTDCDSYVIEAADKNRFRYMKHNCPGAYYEKVRLKAVWDYEAFYERIRFLSIYKGLNPFIHGE